MDHKQIISLWPTIADFAADIGVSEKTATQMKWRGSIPGKYWLAASQGAERRGLHGCTLKTLAAYAAKDTAA